MTTIKRKKSSVKKINKDLKKKGFTKTGKK